MDLLTPSSLLAEIQSGVMARSLAIALVVVAPFWVALRRRLRQRAEADRTDDAASPAPRAPTLEAVIEQISRLAERPDSLDGADGDGSDGDGSHERARRSVTVHVPRGVTIDGEPAPDAVVDAIVRDALQRSGLVPTAELDTPDGRTIECQLPQVPFGR